MPAHPDRQRFRNEDLLLKVSPAVDRAKWNENRYEAFIDELCGERGVKSDFSCKSGGASGLMRQPPQAQVWLVGPPPV